MVAAVSKAKTAARVTANPINLATLATKPGQLLLRKAVNAATAKAAKVRANTAAVAAAVAGVAAAAVAIAVKAAAEAAVVAIVATIHVPKASKVAERFESVS